MGASPFGTLIDEASSGTLPNAKVEEPKIGTDQTAPSTIVRPFAVPDDAEGRFTGRIVLLPPDIKELPEELGGDPPETLESPPNPGRTVTGAPSTTKVISGQVVTQTIDVSSRPFTDGFPGLTDRFEWFALDYRGRCTLSKSGTYQFRLLADDGARLFVDDRQIIDNDGVHPAIALQVGIELEAGQHDLRVTYFQGPRTEIALQLFVTAPGGTEEIFRCTGN